MADNYLGWVSAKFESGGLGASAVSGGIGDAGGQSYGVFQMSSKRGVVSQYLAQSKFGSYFSGLTPATSAFNEKWKWVAANNPDFGADQAAFIGKSHYAPQVAIARGIGLDVDKHGPAIREALFSIGVQYGPNSQVVVKALSGKIIAQMTEIQIINAIYDYKKATVKSYFVSSSAAVQASVSRRVDQERQVVLGMTQEAAYPGTTPIEVPPPPKADAPLEGASNGVVETKKPQTIIEIVLGLLKLLFKR